MRRLFVRGLILMLIGLTAPAMTSEKCGNWLSEDFFKTADISAVRECVADMKSLSARDDEGRTPLHLAVKASQDVSVILELLRLGADVSLLDASGRSVIHDAAEHSTVPEVIPLLENRGQVVLRARFTDCAPDTSRAV